MSRIDTIARVQINKKKRRTDDDCGSCSGNIGPIHSNVTHVSSIPSALNTTPSSPIRIPTTVQSAVILACHVLGNLIAQSALVPELNVSSVYPFDFGSHEQTTVDGPTSNGIPRVLEPYAARVPVTRRTEKSSWFFARPSLEIY